MNKRSIDSTNLSDTIWTVRHCAAYIGVHEQYYRRNILIRADHPKGINPEKRRLDFFRLAVRPWLDELMAGSQKAG